MTNLEASSSPIAVFDSGLGGLTVLKSLALGLPQENFVYLGDTARLPYGSKSPDQIRKLLHQNIQYLKSLQAKAIVIACNSASSVILDQQSDSVIPVYNVIRPGAEQAHIATLNKKVGIIGTRATVRGQAYLKELKKLDPEIEVFQQACPLFVPLVEEGWFDDPLTNLIAYRYIQPLVASQMDTLILGCTHYPILKESIRKVTGPNIRLIDSAQSITELIKTDLRDHVILPNEQNQKGQIKILTTDALDPFQSLAEKIMNPVSPTSFEVVDTHL